MAKKSKIDIFAERYPELELLKVDGFDDAVVGVELSTERVVYDADLMTDILMQEGMEEIDAIDYLHYNVFNAYVGERTPIYINQI